MKLRDENSIENERKELVKKITDPLILFSLILIIFPILKGFDVKFAYLFLAIALFIFLFNIYEEGESK